MRHSSRHPDRPILITEAPINVDDEYNRRRRRYLIMMIIRALCIIGAATTFTYSGWLAAAFVAAAVVLPWSAVLIANDRPPKQAVRFRRFLPGNHVGNELVAGRDTDESGPDDRYADDAQSNDEPPGDRRFDDWHGPDQRSRPAEQASPRIIDI